MPRPEAIGSMAVMVSMTSKSIGGGVENQLLLHGIMNLNVTALQLSERIHFYSLGRFTTRWHSSRLVITLIQAECGTATHGWQANPATIADCFSLTVVRR